MAKEHALRKAAAKEKDYGAANMSADMGLQFQFRLSDVETEATPGSVADTERVTYQLEREIYGITLNEQIWFKKEFSLRLIEYQAWWKTISIEQLRKTIQQLVIHFGYPKMHLVSHKSNYIPRMDSSDNCTTDISEPLQIANVDEAYRSSNKPNHI